MSIRTFLMKKMLASKMKDIPAGEQEKIFSAIEKNPTLFENIANEVQTLTKNGKDQMAATMEVVQKYQNELKKLM